MSNWTCPTTGVYWWHCLNYHRHRCNRHRCGRCGRRVSQWIRRPLGAVHVCLSEPCACINAFCPCRPEIR